MRCPDAGLAFAVPNGGDRHPAVAAKLKAEGVKSGVPDIVLPVARGGYFGLIIEMKRQTGGRTSTNQNRWIKDLEAQGYAVHIARGWISAKEIIEEYLAAPRTKGGLCIKGGA